MPLYTYQCRKCGKVMDKVYPINDCPRVVGCIFCRKGVRSH
jgi:putative FmdB family regulatory protein